MMKLHKNKGPGKYRHWDTETHPENDIFYRCQNKYKKLWNYAAHDAF